MDEILKKLLESEMLSEEVKTELKAQWDASVAALKETLKEEAEADVRAELSEQWIAERDALIESLEKFTSEKLDVEIAELREDVERFRDLEAEYAEKLVEEKRALAEKLSEELDSLVDRMDEFFELRLEEEINDLKEDIQLVRENEFGRRMFESFVAEYNRSFVDDTSVQKKLSVSEDKLHDAEKAIAKLEESIHRMERDKKLEEVLAPLSGAKREQMAFILSNVETRKLEEAYKMFIGRVLKEEVKAEEAKTTTKQTIVEEKEVEPPTTVVTGDSTPAISEAPVKVEKSQELIRTLSLAGVKYN